MPARICRLTPRRAALALLAAGGLAHAAAAQGPTGGPAGGPGGSSAPVTPPSRYPAGIPGGAGPAPSPAAAPKALPSPFEADVDAKGAVEAARAKAAARATRVLVVFGPSDDSTWEEKLEWVVRTPGVQELLGREYEPVWVNVRTGAHAAANAEFAKSLGAEMPEGEKHAKAVVLDAKGRKVAAGTFNDFTDEIRLGTYSPMKVEDFLVQNRAVLPPAANVLDAALEKAKSEGKGVLLVVSWATKDWSVRFRDLLKTGPVGSVVTKHYVVASVLMERNDGSGKMLEERGPKGLRDLPWFAALDAEGKTLATSVPDGKAAKDNIGYPTGDDEIGVFIHLLRAGAPKMTPQEEAAVREALREGRKPAAP